MPNEQTNQQQTTTTGQDNIDTVQPSRDELNEMMEKKIAAHLTRFKGALAKDFEGTISKTISPLAEKLAELTQPKVTDDDTTQQLQAKYDAELGALKKQVAERERLLAEEKQQRVEQEERTALSNALTAKGVTGPHLEGAMALLYLAEKRIARDDKGVIGIKFARSGYDEVMPLDAGLDELFKADKYRIYLPARPAAGSGTTGGKPAQGNGKLTKEQERAEAMRMLIPAFINR